MKCSHLRCSRQATWDALLTFPCPGAPDETTELTVGISVCPQHRTELVIGDIIEDLWQQFREQALAQGNLLPRRESLYLTFRPLA